MTASIRSTHRYGFRNGQWATLTGVVWTKGRPCFEVTFDDGVIDQWPIHDTSDAYEFTGPAT